MAKMSNRGHISDFEKKTILALHEDYYPSKIARIFNVSEATIRNQIDDPRLPSQRKSRENYVDTHAVLREKITSEVIMPLLEATNWKVKSPEVYQNVLRKFPNSVGPRTVLNWVSKIRKQQNRINYETKINRKTKKVDMRLVENMHSVIDSLGDYFSITLIAKYTGLPEKKVKSILTNGVSSVPGTKLLTIKRNFVEPMSIGRKLTKVTENKKTSSTKIQTEVETISELIAPMKKVKKQSKAKTIQSNTLANVRTKTIIPLMIQYNWQISTQEVYDFVLNKYPDIMNFQMIECEIELVKLAHNLFIAKISETQLIKRK